MSSGLILLVVLSILWGVEPHCYQPQGFPYNTEAWKLPFIILLHILIYSCNLKCLNIDYVLIQIHNQCLNTQEKLSFKVFFNRACEFNELNIKQWEINVGALVHKHTSL